LKKEYPKDSMNKNHKNKFKTPQGYFEGFNERLFTRMEAEENGPNTDFLPKSDGFGVPDAYFENVYPRVQSKLENSTPKVISLNRYKTVYYAAAAVAVIFVLSLTWRANQEQPLNFEDLASADIETYLEDYDFGLSSYEIAENVNLDDISISDITEKSLEDESILEYLDENVEDLEDLDLNYEELQ
jgi:hypothetical protein